MRLSPRSHFETPEYWRWWNEFRQESISLYRPVANNPTTTAIHRRRLLLRIYHEILHLAISGYSAGDDLAGLRRWIPEAVNTLAEYQMQPGSDRFDFKIREWYVEACWLLSLAFLLRTEQDVLNKLLPLLGNSGRDFLFDRIAAACGSEGPVSNEVLHKKPYDSLRQAWNADPSERESLIRTFLKAYYPSMRQCYWFDRHKNPDAGFFGYWCFELAAAVAILEIPDEGFASNPYYPKDLVLFFRESGS